MTNNEIFYATATLLERPFIMAATKQGLCYVDSTEYTFTELTNRFKRYSANFNLIENKAFIKPFKEQLKAYIKGDLKIFDVPLVLNGTNFQVKVWKALQNIPYGQTASYLDLALKLDRDHRSSQAIGGAVGANPLSIVYPCHRVVGNDGSLTGYAGGLDIKRSLLNHELEHAFQNYN